MSKAAMISRKVAEFLEQAEHYRHLKEQMSHLPTRSIFEQMEKSYRVLAHSQQQLERSKKFVEAPDQWDK